MLFSFCNQYFLAGSKALVEILRSTVSKRDLKHSGTFFSERDACDLGFAGTRCSWTFASGGRLSWEAYKGIQIKSVD